MLNVNNKLCIKCGICADICPIKIISLKKGIPCIIPERVDNCMNCGHCVAACPNAAISLDSMLADECEQISKNIIDKSSLKQLFMSRRSVRHYKDKPVDKSKINELIEIANYAPTGRNEEEISWIVVSDKAILNKLIDATISWMKKESASSNFLSDYFSGLIKSREKGNDPILRGAPAVIIAIADNNIGVAVEDGATAISYIELAAPQFELGSCWAGFLYYAINAKTELQQLLQIKEEQKCVGAVMLGEAKHRYHRIPKRSNPRIDWF